MTTKFYSLLLGSLLTCLSSCSVYRPTVPLLPAIRQAHELEVKVAADDISDDGPVYGAASVAYSPVRHLLLTAGGAGSARAPQRGGYKGLQRHVEAGIGGYLPLRNDVLSTQVGIATGNSSDLRTAGVGFLGYYTALQQTHVDFRRWQAQVGWQHYYALSSGIVLNAGVLYRFFRIFYQQYRVISINQNSSVPGEPETEYFSIPTLNRHEVLTQLNLGLAKHPAWQIHLGFG